MAPQLLAFLLLIGLCEAQDSFPCIKELYDGPYWGSPLQSYQSSDFNVIVFNDWSAASSGDVEGRVAVKGNTSLGNGFSIGYEVNTVKPDGDDNSQPYSLVVGRNLYWGSGALFPDGSGNPNASPAEGMYVGGTASVPPYLTERLTAGPCATPGCLDSAFSVPYNYFQSLVNTWSTSSPNTMIAYYDNGIFVSSDNRDATRYYLQVDNAYFSKSTWWSFQNINPVAEFIVNIFGSGDVTFQGGNFPAIPEKTVFNIAGTGKTIHVIGEAYGSLLAPNHRLNQTGSDLTGFVVVSEVIHFIEARKPHCKPPNSCDCCNLCSL